MAFAWFAAFRAFSTCFCQGQHCLSCGDEELHESFCSRHEDLETSQEPGTCLLPAKNFLRLVQIRGDVIEKGATNAQH